EGGEDGDDGGEILLGMKKRGFGEGKWNGELRLVSGAPELLVRHEARDSQSQCCLHAKHPSSTAAERVGDIPSFLIQIEHTLNRRSAAMQSEYSPTPFFRMSRCPLRGPGTARVGYTGTVCRQESVAGLPFV
ncbi:unnamed protein product, partial [Scytosiphon promiscuus]